MGLSGQPQEAFSFLREDSVLYWLIIQLHLKRKAC